jgi:hypothetical protein
MFTGHDILPATTTSSTIHHPSLQYRLVESVIMLQYMYPKPYTHQVTVLSNPKVLSVILTFYWVSIKDFLMQLKYSIPHAHQIMGSLLCTMLGISLLCTQAGKRDIFHFCPYLCTVTPYLTG